MSQDRLARAVLGLAPLLLALAGCGSPATPGAPATIPAPGPEAAAALPAGPGVPQVRRLKRRDWVEVSARVLAPDSEAPADARDRALAEARRAAIEAVAGIRVRSSLVSWEGVRDADASSLVQTLTASRADAMVLDEELVSSQLTPLRGGGYQVAVVMRARVLDRSKRGDPDFRIQVQLDRDRFLAGEEVSLAVRSSRRSRIYVLGITEDGAALLLPNRWLRDTQTDAGEWLRFPDADLRDRGVRLIAQVPQGRKSATEALVVVALRGDRQLDGLLPLSGQAFRDADAQGAGGLLAELLTPLSELPPDDWAFDQVVYEVLAR